MMSLHIFMFRRCEHDHVCAYIVRILYICKIDKLYFSENCLVVHIFERIKLYVNQICVCDSVNLSLCVNMPWHRNSVNLCAFVFV